MMMAETIGVPVEEWDLLERSRLNALLVGPPTVTRQLVDSLGPQLATPIVRLQPNESIVFPNQDPVGTVILDDIGELHLRDQRRLLEWLDHASGPPRIISTTPQPIIAKVSEGAFLPALYYRLNLFYVDVAHAPVDGGPS